MTSQINANGLTVDSLTEIISQISTGLQGVYGADINIDQNSPDGQAIGIFSQAVEDLLEFLVSINNGFDPDQAVGAILDQRVAINNIQRAGGTYTVQPITIVVTSTVSLQGLDDNYASPTGTGYTVQDSAGNEFILATSETLVPGTYVRNFRAQQIGLVSVPVNTITTPVTIVIGVASVNNPTAALTVGQNQETDQQLRTRRQQSTALATTGYLNGLLGAIQNLAGVTEAVLYDNRTDGVVNTMAAHSIWLIVAGGAASDIANTIYEKISDGCNQNGAQTYNITTPSNAIFTAKWDTPTAESLYIKFSIQTTSPGFIFSQPAIKASMAASLTYGIGQAAETSRAVDAALAAIAAQGGGGVPIAMLVSDDGVAWVDYVEPTNINYQFTLATANIAITIIP